MMLMDGAKRNRAYIAWSVFLHFVSVGLLVHFSKQIAQNPRRLETTRINEAEGKHEIKEKSRKGEDSSLIVLDVSEPQKLPPNSVDVEKIFLSDKTRYAEKNQVAKNSGSGKKAIDLAKNQKSAKSASSTIGKKTTNQKLQLIDPLSYGGYSDAAKLVESMSDEQKRKNGDGQAVAEFIIGEQQGPSTLLNTREYVYASYFGRLRNQLREHWESILRDEVTKSFRKGRQISSSRNYQTQALVTLGADGSVVSVEIEGSSGMRELDDAGVKAFNKAGPFPNPPRGLLKSENHIKFHWDFIVRT